MYAITLTRDRYLLDDSSGPFVDPIRALYTTALGCVAYIHMSLDLAEYQASEQLLVEAVANGFHGFHDYATSAWLDHAREVAMSSSGLPHDANDPLLQQLAKTYERADKLQPSLSRNYASAGADCVMAKKVDCFAASRPLLLMAQCIWQHDQNGEAQASLGKDHFYWTHTSPDCADSRKQINPSTSPQ